MSRGRGTYLALIAVLAAMLPGAAYAVTRAAAPAAKHPTLTPLLSNNVRLKSSTGRHLYIGVEAARYSFRPRASNPVTTQLDVQVSDSRGEDHDWSFTVANPVLRYDRNTGRGTLQATSKQMHSFGGMSLRVVKRGAPAVHDCANGESFTRQHVTLTGRLTFRTRSSAWGRLGGGAPLTFKGRSIIETDYGSLEKLCDATNRLPRCSGHLAWYSPGGDGGGFNGDSDGPNDVKLGFLALDTEEALKSTNNQVSREDDVFVNDARQPTFTSLPDGTKQVTVHAGTHGDITGSATLVSTGPATTGHSSCRGGATTSWLASFTNGKNPLTVHMDIGGSFSPRNSAAGAGFSRDPR
jgi:hypothetical protein